LKIKKQILTIVICLLAALSFASSASASLTGDYEKFSQCPYSNLEVRKCIFSVTESGEVVLGSKAVPIVNPVTLQGGVEAVGEDEFAQFVAASNGITLSKSPQPVPGGLAGLVKCKEISDALLRLTCEATFENGLTGASSTLELAKPASSIRVSENHLAGEYETALELPVKIHLENPFLGSACYVGSNAAPIIWKLTSGETSPPGPNKSIKGSAGEIEFFDEGRILETKNAALVDNAWSAPGVNGCGGFLVELLLNPVVNTSAGLPAAAGKNTAVLINTINVAAAAAVRRNNAENP
jgi:hypothetical protein